MTFDAGIGTARDVSRDANGNVEFTSAGTGSVTGVTQTGVTNTTTVSGSGRVMYDKFQGGINTGTADLSLLRNGSVITSKTGVTSGDGIFAAGTPRISSPDWSLKANWQGFGQTTIDQTTETSVLEGSDGFTLSDTAQLTGQTDSLRMKAQVTLFGGQTGSLKFKTSGNTFYTLTGSPNGTYTYTTTGSFSSPQVTWYAKGSGFGGNGDLRTRTAALLGVASGTANLTASKNKVTTVS